MNTQYRGFWKPPTVAFNSHPTLETSLIAYWKLDETSGTRDDSHGANDLTDNNTVTSTTGKISNAAELVSANNEHLTITDNTDLSTGDIDFTLAGWLQISNNAINNTIFAKGTANTTAGIEYRMQYIAGATNRFQFSISNGTTIRTVTANNFGAASNNTWYFFVCYHDAANDVIGIKINATTTDTAATSGTPPQDSTGTFYLGRSVTAANMGGLLDEIGFWKKVLSAQEMSDLYNSGSGLTY